MHPLEQYHLQDPGVYWNASTLVGAFNEPSDPTETLKAASAQFTDFYLLSRSYITVANASNREEILAGAPINATTGLSSAKVYYSVFDLDDRYFVYNYNLYYSFNGCSSQILSLVLDGQYESTQYIMCPTGIHEGDWERVTVLVCKQQQRVRRVVLSQHGWNTHYNCDIGECTFDGSHPVVYSALNSHANYPSASPAWVYAEARLDFLPNFDGVFIVDRTLRGRGPSVRFVPTPDNIVFLNTDPTVANDTDDIWTVYLGAWGASAVPEPYTISCISQNQTTFVECPDNSATERLLNVVQRVNTASGNENSTVTSDNGTVADAGSQIIATTVTRVFEADGSTPRGPITRDFSFYWTPPKAAPLWTGEDGLLGLLVNGTAAPVCPASGDPSNTVTVPVNWKRDDLQAYLIGIAVGVIAFAVLMTLVLMLPPIVKPTTAAIILVPVTDRKRKAGADRGTRLRATVVPVEHVLRVTWVVLALMLYVAGAVLVGIGCQSLWSVLQDLLSISLWSTLRGIFIALITAVGFLDLVFAIILATLHPFACCSLFSYRRMKEAVLNPRRRGNVTSALMTGCILLVISVIILLFAFGVVITVARKVFAKACRTVVGKAVSVIGGSRYCINLRQFGFDKEYCLFQLAVFCNKWETLRVNNIVLGSVLMLWAHLMFLLLVGRNFALTREYRLQAEAARHPPAMVVAKPSPASSTFECEDQPAPEQFDVEQPATQSER